jgi:hypothetical protein
VVLRATKTRLPLIPHSGEERFPAWEWNGYDSDLAARDGFDFQGFEDAGHEASALLTIGLIPDVQ